MYISRLCVFFFGFHFGTGLPWMFSLFSLCVFMGRERLPTCTEPYISVDADTFPQKRYLNSFCLLTNCIFVFRWTWTQQDHWKCWRSSCLWWVFGSACPFILLSSSHLSGGNPTTTLCVFQVSLAFRLSLLLPGGEWWASISCLGMQQENFYLVLTILKHGCVWSLTLKSQTLIWL